MFRSQQACGKYATVLSCSAAAQHWRAITVHRSIPICVVLRSTLRDKTRPRQALKLCVQKPAGVRQACQRPQLRCCIPAQEAHHRLRLHLRLRRTMQAPPKSRAEQDCHRWLLDCGVQRWAAPAEPLCSIAGQRGSRASRVAAEQSRAPAQLQPKQRPALACCCPRNVAQRQLHGLRWNACCCLGRLVRTCWPEPSACFASASARPRVAGQLHADSTCWLLASYARAGKRPAWSKVLTC